VVNELKDKAPGVMAIAGSSIDPGSAAPDVPDAVLEAEPVVPTSSTSHAKQASQAEALSALGNLGYAPGEAAAAVAQALDEGTELDTPALILAALKLLAPAG